MYRILTATGLLLGATIVTQPARSIPNADDDSRIDPQIRPFLATLNKDSSPFWELPQPKPQEILSGLQSQTPVDMSGVTTTERTINQDGRTVKLYVMKPERVSGRPGGLTGLGADIALGPVPGLIGLAALHTDQAVVGLRGALKVGHLEGDQLAAPEQGGKTGFPLTGRLRRWSVNRLNRID
jgi:hypothetical protein